MKILFAPAAELVTDRRAHGEGLIASALLRRLAGRGHQVVAYAREVDLAEPIPGVELRTARARGATAALSRLAFARRIARETAGERYDVIHDLFPITTADGYTMAGGAPLVVGPLNLPWPDERKAASRPTPGRAVRLLTDPLERRLHRRTLRRAAGILVTGRPALAAIPPSLHPRCVDVPFGVDTSRFTPSELPDAPVVLFFSVLLPRKGFEVLLRAFALLRQRIPRARLLIAGDDPLALTPAGRELCERLGVAGSVEFVGAVAIAEAPALFRRARVFCQPSLGEPFGMTVLEAMATGRPVVATSAGGLTGIVVEGEGGRLAPPGDHRLLADALVAVLRDPAAARAMGAFNRDRVERRFSIDGAVERIEQTYRDVTRERRGVGLAASA